MADFNIRGYGAIGDGVSNNAAAIQAAIDACTTSGGGRVIVPTAVTGSVYLTGTITLKSNVDLHIERGAALEASGDAADYRAATLDPLPGAPGISSLSDSITFITAHHASNIAITGGGVIDGGGRKFIAEKLPNIYRMKRQRPFTVFLVGCTNITMRGIVVRDGAVWTLRFSGCDDLLIDGIRIDNDLKLPNNDGIDLDHCRNVRIANCHIVSGDDCICLKTCSDAGDFGPCENITVTGCTLVSTSTALILGCENHQPMRNIVFDSCVIRASNRGLGIHMSYESVMENVLFSNMVIETRLFDTAWWGAAEPMYVTVAPWTEADTIGLVRHIRFSNVLCQSESGVVIYCPEAGHIEDILFENVRVELNKTSKWEGGYLDLRPMPGEDMPKRALSGFRLENARGVTLRNCEVAWGENRPDYYHHALEAVNVADLKIENLKGVSADPVKYAAVWEH